MIPYPNGFEALAPEARCDRCQQTRPLFMWSEWEAAEKPEVLLPTIVTSNCPCSDQSIQRPRPAVRAGAFNEERFPDVYPT